MYYNVYSYSKIVVPILLHKETKKRRMMTICITCLKIPQAHDVLSKATTLASFFLKQLASVGDTVVFVCCGVQAIQYRKAGLQRPLKGL